MVLLLLLLRSKEVLDLVNDAVPLLLEGALPGEGVVGTRSRSGRR